MQSQSVLDNFDALRKPSKVRHACFKLIKHLEKSQQTLEKGEDLSKEMKYALKRLIRGMGSADQNTVVGFSACLASLLKAHADTIKMTTLQEYIESELELKSSLLRGEEGMVTFGRVLVYGCIIRSSIFEKLNEEQKSFILDQLLLFCYKRSYVSAPVYYYIEQFLKTVNFDKKYMKIVMSHVLNNKFHMNIDMLHLILTLQNIKLPALLESHSKFSISTSLPNIYQLDTLPEFINILIDIRSTDDLNLNVYARFANNLLHVYSKKSPQLVQAVWNHIETSVLTSRDLTLNKKLAVFKLFASLILHCESTQQILSFLTPNFLHTAVKSTSEIPPDLTASTSPMHVLAQKFSSRLVLKRKTDKLGYETVEHGSQRVDESEAEDDSDSDVSDDEVGDTLKVRGEDVLRMIELFLREPPLVNVEKMTHTKILQTLIGALDKAQVKQLTVLYKSILSDVTPPTPSITPSKKQKKQNGAAKTGEEIKRSNYNNKDKIYVLNLLTKLVFHPSFNERNPSSTPGAGGKSVTKTGQTSDTEDQTWKYEQVEYVFDLALGVSPWNHEVAAAYKRALFGLLGHQLHHGLLERLVQHANLLIEKSGTKNFKMTPEIGACWSQSLQMIGQLNQTIAACPPKSGQSPSTDSRRSVLIAFQTMYLQLCLYLFLDNSISIEVIQELNHCYERFNEKKKKKKAVTDDEAEPHWIEVITELFLSLLSKDSVLLRHLVAKVFKLLVPVINAQAVQQILQVLDPAKNPLKGNFDSEDEDEDDEGLDEEETSGGEEEEDKEEEEEEEEEESDIDEEYLGNETNTDKLRQAVNQALGMNGNITDAESVDLSDLDQDEARQLDVALASAFSAVKRPSASGRTTKHQSKAEARLVSFRVRVLDLVEALVAANGGRSGAAPAACLDILATLFVLLRHSLTRPSQKPLETRVRGVLRQFASAGGKKSGSAPTVSPSGSEVTDALLTDVLLNSVLAKGDTSMSTVQTIGGEISGAILFLVRTHASISSASEDLSQSTFVQALLDTLEAFFTKRQCIVSSHLFKSLFSISWPGNVHFLAALPSYAFNKELRYYNRANALSLLYVLLRNRYFIDSVREDKSTGGLKKMEASLSEVVTRTCEFLQDPSELSKAVSSYTKSLCDVIITIKSRSDILKARKLDPLKTALQSVTLHVPALGRLYAAFDIKKSDTTTTTNGIVDKSKSKKKTKSNGQTKSNGLEDEADSSDNEEEKEEEEEEEEDSDGEEKEKKKKKKHRSSKTSKQTKLLRMTDLSKGIEDVGGFSSLHVDKDATPMEVDEENGTEEEERSGGDGNKEKKKGERRKRAEEKRKVREMNGGGESSSEEEEEEREVKKRRKMERGGKKKVVNGH